VHRLQPGHHGAGHLGFRLALAVASLAGFAASSWSSDASAAILQRPRAVSAFYTPDDGYMHAIVAQTDGSIREVYFLEGSFVSSSVIATFSGVMGVTAYYTPVDGYRHAIVALANGQIWEVYYQPKFGISQDLLTTLDPNVFGTPYSVAGWVTPDATQNIVVGTSGVSRGALYHFTFYPQSIRLEGAQLGTTFPSDITAWSSTDSSGTTNYLSANGGNGTAGALPFIMTYSWASTGSIADATGPTFNDWPSGQSTPILSIGGLADPGLADPSEMFYIDGAANLRDDFSLLENAVTSFAPIAAPLPAPGVSLGAAMEPNGRRHAIVATSDSELIDYRATGRGSWESYFLGTF
jgi:hypothetical protein